MPVLGSQARMRTSSLEVVRLGPMEIQPELRLLSYVGSGRQS